MAQDRRLFNEHTDDDWGLRGGRHRGDEATQAKTWADGCLGEAVLGRLLRSVGHKALRLSPPVEWVPSTEPDIIFSGATTFRADIKSSNYRRGTSTSWTVNEHAHHKAKVDGYLAADLADKGTVHVFWYPKAAVDKGDLLTRRVTRAGKTEESRFYRLFFPAKPQI
ncbi:Uncharacterised protein [Burkholderia pseudomallei]|nr:Uncharacterised protein [Burkholderia pseudomallei]